MAEHEEHVSLLAESALMSNADAYRLAQEAVDMRAERDRLCIQLADREHELIQLREALAASEAMVAGLREAHSRVCWLAGNVVEMSLGYSLDDRTCLPLPPSLKQWLERLRDVLATTPPAAADAGEVR